MLLFSIYYKDDENKFKILLFSEMSFCNDWKSCNNIMLKLIVCYWFNDYNESLTLIDGNTVIYAIHIVFKVIVREIRTTYNKQLRHRFFVTRGKKYPNYT